MSQRGWLFLTVVLLMSAAFAGCLGDEDTPADTGDDQGTGGDGNDGDGSDGGDGTDGDGGDGGDGTDAVNKAPEALFDVVLDGGNATVGSNVTFNASKSSDPEGTNLTFTWDFGDGTTADGIEAVHAFATAGNHTVTLVATDGDGFSDTTNQTIEVLASAPAGFTESFEGTITAPNPLLVTRSGAESDYMTVAGVEDTTYKVHEVTGVPTEGTKLTFDMETATAAGLIMVVFAPDGTNLGQSRFPSGSPDVVLEDAAALGHGEYTILVYSAILPNAAYTIDVTLE